MKWFAESLNGVVQKEQADIKIRFWSNGTGCKSLFLERGIAEAIGYLVMKTLGKIFQ